MKCPICWILFNGRTLINQDVVTTWCGHKFHTNCLTRALADRNVCPICVGILGSIEQVFADILLYQQIMAALKTCDINAVKKLFDDNRGRILGKTDGTLSLFNKALKKAQDMAIVNDNLVIAIDLQKTLGAKTKHSVRAQAVLDQKLETAIVNDNLVFASDLKNLGAKNNERVQAMLDQNLETAIVNGNLVIARDLMNLKAKNSERVQSLLDQNLETAIVNDNLVLASNLQNLGAKNSERAQAELDQYLETAIVNGNLVLASYLQNLGAKKSERAQALLNQALIKAVLRGLHSRALKLRELGAKITQAGLEQAFIQAVMACCISDFVRLRTKLIELTPAVQAVLNQALKKALMENLELARRLRECGAAISQAELNQQLIQAVMEDNTFWAVHIFEFEEIAIADETRAEINKARNRAKDKDDGFLVYYYEDLLNKIRRIPETA